MPFEPIATRNTHGGGERVLPDAVMVAAHKTHGGDTHLMVRIGQEMVERLGWTVSQDRIAVLEGSGREAGFLKLALAASGPSYKLTVPGGHARAKSGGVVKVSGTALRHHIMPRQPIGQTRVETQAFAGELLVLLPEWVQRRGEG